jgi:hypothetical protein
MKTYEEMDLVVVVNNNNYNNNIIIIIIIITLQPFVGPSPLFQSLDPTNSRWDSLDGGSASRKPATYTKNNTNTE